MSSTVKETDIGKIAITPRENDLNRYDILDLVVVDGRAYLSLVIGNVIEALGDETQWMQITENSYDMAVRTGIFTGTEEEWLASLSSASNEAAQLAMEQIEACEKATEAAVEATGKADEAADRLNTLSDNRDQIIDGYWWRYSEETGEYEETGCRATGDTNFATLRMDPETGCLFMHTDPSYDGPDFAIDERSGMLQVII